MVHRSVSPPTTRVARLAGLGIEPKPLGSPGRAGTVAAAQYDGAPALQIENEFLIGGSRVREAASAAEGPDLRPGALGRSQMCFAVRHCGRECAGPVYWAAAADGAARVSGAAGLGMS
jgi:hypothetical protein